MKKYISLLILFTLLSNLHSSSNPANGGWVEEKDGVKILHISGTNYEMGYQHGYLLREEVRENIRAILNGASMQKLMKIWNITSNYISPAYIEEMHGIADGSGVPFKEIACAYILISTWVTGCFGISAWGPATVDGRLYHFRSLDLPLNICDPVTKKCVHDNSILIVRKPEKGIESISPSVAGAINGGGGFNAAGIAIGMHTSPSRDFTFHGIPAIFRVQQVLDKAGTLDDAIGYITTNKTGGWTFIISDAKIPIGYAVEVSANYSYVGTYDNPVESNPPFWQIDHMVRRTNFFIYPPLAYTQRSNYDPSGIAGLIRLIIWKEPYFAIWRSYKAMSELLEENYGKISLNKSMEFFQEGYRGDTDFILKFLINLAEGTSFNRAWNMWVACPERGEIAVSFASGNKTACEMQYHYFKFWNT